MNLNGTVRSIVTIVAAPRTACLSLAVLAGTLLAAPAANAAEATNGVPGDWLSRYASARSIGLGGAFVAAADEPLGALWNPAGLTLSLQNEVHFETARYFEDTAINGLSFAIPARRLPTIGFTMLSLGSGKFEKTNELNESLGSFEESDMAFLISASKSVTPRLSLGANIKVVRQQVEDFDATGVGADVGVMFGLTPRLRLGASLLNIGGPTLQARDVAESFPIEMRAGAALAFLSGRGLLSLEVDHREGPGTSFRAGSEMWFYDHFGLRVGYFGDEPAGGFSYRLNQAMRFDYGMSDHELGPVHHVAVSYRFGGFFANSYANPEVFSPLGETSVTKFNIKARTKAETKQWRLDIVDKHNQVVRSFGGLGVPPAHVMWDGKDENGMTLADGQYRYQLFVTDEEGRILRTDERTVVITTSGPQGGVPVIVD
ncbi:MAG TPA: PorV/PorQ family protein [Candidatus Krumholzibacteria bacterium]|nr:PorV/PorQ family protein [Candidatus Krumholzibacteria bacterium]